MARKINWFVLMVFVVGILPQPVFAPISDPETIDPFKQSGLTFNPANPSTFDWNKGDLSGVDWNLVTMTPQIWNRITPENIKHIPADKLDLGKMKDNQIAKLSPGQKRNLKASQIKDHLDKLGNLAEYGKAKEAIKDKYGVTVTELGKGAKIDKNGALKATFGKEGHITLKKETYKKGNIQVLPDGRIEFKITDESGALDIPSVDEVRVVIPQEKSIQYKDTHIIEDGSVYFKNGQMILEKGKTVTIDGIIIESRKEPTNIYLKKGKYSGNYFFLDLHNNEMGFGTDDKGNVIIQPTEASTFFEVTEKSLLQIEASQGSSVNIVFRESQNLVPLITAKTGANDEGVRIINGKIVYVVQNGELEQSVPLLGKFSSIPLVLNIRSHQGLNTLGNNGEKIIFDKFNDFLMLDNSIPKDKSECFKCLKNFRKQGKVYANYFKGKFRKLTGKKRFLRGTNDPVKMSKILEEYKKLTRAQKESIPSITLSARPSKACGYKTKISGCADPTTRKIILDLNDETSWGGDKVLAHEATHTLVFKTEAREKKTKKEFKRLQRQWNREIRSLYKGEARKKYSLKEFREKIKAARDNPDLTSAQQELSTLKKSLNLEDQLVLNVLVKLYDKKKKEVAEIGPGIRARWKKAAGGDNVYLEKSLKARGKKKATLMKMAVRQADKDKSHFQKGMISGNSLKDEDEDMADIGSTDPQVLAQLIHKSPKVGWGKVYLGLYMESISPAQYEEMKKELAKLEGKT